MLDETINRLTHLYNGYLPELEVKKAIKELKTLRNTLSWDVENNFEEFLEIETKLLEKFELNSKKRGLK